MADHAWQPGPKTLIPEMRSLRGTVAIGGTGAVGAYEMNGVYSVTRVSAGLYRLKTGDDANHVDVYGALLFASATVKGVTGQDLVGQLTAATLSTGVYDFTFLTGTVATDPTSGNSIMFALDFRDAAEAVR